MTETTKAESGRKGGYRKWAKFTKEERSEMMREVVKARWAKKKQLSSNRAGTSV